MVRISAEIRRAELLRAALRVMARDGLNAGTTRAIVAEAGMSLASFHYCFRSRNELLRELTVLVSGLERQAVSTAVDPARLLAQLGPSPEPAPGSGAEDQYERFRTILRTALAGYLEHLAADPGHELFRLELHHYLLRTPELRPLADDQYRGYDDLAMRLLTVAAELSGLTWQLDRAVPARLVVIMLDGARPGWLVDRRTDLALAVLDQVVAHLSTLVAPSSRSPSTRSR